MMRKAFLFLSLFLVLSVSVPALAAPPWVFEPTLLPQTNNLFDLGTTTKTWRTLFVTQICLSADCKSAWPAGGSGSGVSTSTPIAGGNLGVYSAAGAGSFFGIGTSTLSATSPLTGSFVQVGSGGSLGLGTVPVANGGTNSISYPSNSIITSNAAGDTLVATTSTPLYLSSIYATSTSATSTLKSPLLLDSAPTNLSNFLNITASRVYPASVTTGGMVHIDNSTVNSGPALEVVTGFGASATGRTIVFNETNSAFDQDFILASSSAANTTALNVKGAPTGKGIIKCEHTGSGTGYANASCISIDLLNTTDAQGLFIKGAINGTGKLINVVNSSSATLFNVDSIGNSTTTGLSEIDSLSANQVIYTNPNKILVSVATGTVSAGSTAITATANRYVLGGNLAIDCAVASGSQAGCLSTTDWNTFNGKSGFAFPFTPNASYFGVVTNSTTTVIQDTLGFIASSTSKFTALQLGSTTNIAVANANAPLIVTGDVNNFTQAVIRNNATTGNAATNASACLVLENGSSTDSTYFGEICKNGAYYAQAAFNSQNAGDLTLNENDNGLVLGTASTTNKNADVRLTVGGTASSSIRAIFKTIGYNAIGTSSPQLGVLTLGTSTAGMPQLVLSDNTVGDPNYFFRTSNGSLTIGTSTTATTSSSALTLNIPGQLLTGTNGALATPAYSFNASQNSGTYFDSASTLLNLAVSGTLVLSLSTTQVITNNVGSAAVPSFSFGGGISNSGIFGISVAPVGVGLTVSGNESFRTVAGLYSGFGTTTPHFLLQTATSTGFNQAWTDAIAGDAGWGIRNAGGNLYLATTSDTTWASSTLPASLNLVKTTGFLGIASSSPWASLSINNNSLATNPAFAVGSTTATNFIVANSGFVGVGTTSPSALFSINPYLGITAGMNLFAVGSSSKSWFTINSYGAIALSDTLVSTSTAQIFDWSTSTPTTEYQTGISAATITFINATTSRWAGSTRKVNFCNPGATAGAITLTGVANASAWTQTTTANQCDLVGFTVLQGTSTAAAPVYKIYITGVQAGLQ